MRADGALLASQAVQTTAKSLRTNNAPSALFRRALAATLCLRHTKSFDRTGRQAAGRQQPSPTLKLERAADGRVRTAESAVRAAVPVACWLPATRLLDLYVQSFARGALS